MIMLAYGEIVHTYRRRRYVTLPLYAYFSTAAVTHRAGDGKCSLCRELYKVGDLQRSTCKTEPARARTKRRRGQESDPETTTELPPPQRRMNETVATQGLRDTGRTAAEQLIATRQAMELVDKQIENVLKPAIQSGTEMFKASQAVNHRLRANLSALQGKKLLREEREASLKEKKRELKELHEKRALFDDELDTALEANLKQNEEVKKQEVPLNTPLLDKVQLIILKPVRIPDTCGEIQDSRRTG